MYQSVIVEAENDVLRERMRRADRIIGMASALLQHVEAGNASEEAAGVLRDMINEYRKDYARH